MRRHILPNVIEPHRREHGPHVRRRDPHRDDARVHRPGRSVRPVMGPDPQLGADGRCAGPRGVVVHRPAGPASCSSSSRSPSSATPSTTSSTRSAGGASADERAAAIRGRRQWPLPKQADPDAPLLVVEDLRSISPSSPGSRQGGRRGELHAPRRRGARDRRRVRLRQDDDRAVARPAPPVERDGSWSGTRPAVRDRPRPEVRERAPARYRWREISHRLPGRDERAQPGPAGRRPDRRADRGAPGAVAGRRDPPARGRAAGAGRDPAPARAQPTRTSCPAGCGSGR